MTAGSQQPDGLHFRGLMYFAVPSSIQNRMHLIALSFDGLEEQAAIYTWAIGRGYLPALAPQESPGVQFDARPTGPVRRPPTDNGDGDFNAGGEPLCPIHGEDGTGMLESKKERGGYYCGRKDNGQRCSWEWSPKRGFYSVSARGAARR